MDTAEGHAEDQPSANFAEEDTCQRTTSAKRQGATQRKHNSADTTQRNAGNADQTNTSETTPTAGSHRAPEPNPRRDMENPGKVSKTEPEVVVTPASPKEDNPHYEEQTPGGLAPSEQTPPTSRGRKRTQTEEEAVSRMGLRNKTKEELENERKAFDKKMRKMKPEDETHAHAWCTHGEGEKRGYCDIMEGLHFSHFLTGNCKGAEKDGAATCPAYPKEDLEQVEEELINWEEFLKTPTQQSQTPTREKTIIITRDGHTVIAREPSPIIAFPKDHPHKNCRCDEGLRKEHAESGLHGHRRNS